MTKSKPVITRATEEDALDYFAPNLHIKEKMPSLIAWCARVDDKCVALWGFYKIQSRWVGFCNLQPEALEYKKTIHKQAIKAMRHAEALGIKYVYAQADTENEGATRWLQRLGFHLDPRSLYYFRWRAN
jgi:RimJ/RimL family protein N-acetyltransferase